jgi:hypothetical protein
MMNPEFIILIIHHFPFFDRNANFNDFEDFEVFIDQIDPKIHICIIFNVKSDFISIYIIYSKFINKYKIYCSNL